MNCNGCNPQSRTLMIKTKKHLVQTANNFTYLGRSQSALRLANWQQTNEVMQLHTQKRMPWLLVKNRFMTEYRLFLARCKLKYAWIAKYKKHWRVPHSWDLQARALARATFLSTCTATALSIKSRQRLLCVFSRSACIRQTIQFSKSVFKVF